SARLLQHSERVVPLPDTSVRRRGLQLRHSLARPGVQQGKGDHTWLRGSVGYEQGDDDLVGQQQLRFPLCFQPIRYDQRFRSAGARQKRRVRPGLSNAEREAAANRDLPLHGDGNVTYSPAVTASASSSGSLDIALDKRRSNP